MSSTDSVGRSNTNIEQMNLLREDQARKEKETTLKHQEQIKDIERNHVEEIKSIKEGYEETLKHTRESSKHQLAEKDAEYARQIEKLQQIARNQKTNCDFKG